MCWIISTRRAKLFGYSKRQSLVTKASAISCLLIHESIPEIVRFDCRHCDFALVGIRAKSGNSCFGHCSASA